MVKAFLQYMFMLPCFVNMVRLTCWWSPGGVALSHPGAQLTIYSICNMNDISWGTRDNHVGAGRGRGARAMVVHFAHARTNAQHL